VNKSPGKHRKYAKLKKMAGSLPQPFQLPEKFPECVEEEMLTGSLSGKTKKRFMFTVATAIFKHTSYPSKVEYDHVAEQIVKKYKFMGGDKGSHVSLTLLEYLKIENLKKLSRD